MDFAESEEHRALRAAVSGIAGSFGHGLGLPRSY